ncbi:MAG: nucleotidyltransferase family protein [Nanoarchaeota archaeon]
MDKKMKNSGITKAVILAAGLGKRMQQGEAVGIDAKTAQLAGKGLKALIPLGDRPFLDYGIDNLIEAGFREICLVVGTHCEEIREYYESKKKTLAEKGVTVAFAYQAEPKGTANAVYSARSFAGNDEFCLVNCDNVYDVEDLRNLRNAESGRCYTVGYDKNSLARNGNIPRERIERFAVMDVDERMNLKKIVEKPSADMLATNPNLLVSMNCFRFTSRIFEACSKIKPHPERKEYELPSAVQYIIDKDLNEFLVIPSKKSVLDLTGKSDIAPVRKLLAGRKIEW